MKGRFATPQSALVATIALAGLALCRYKNKK